MAVKMISLDIDGTLIDKEHKISEENMSAIKEALRRGIKIVLNTGRYYAAVVKLAQEIKVNAPIISNNGARVTDFSSGDLLLHRSMDSQFTYSLITDCKKKGWDTAILQNGEILVPFLPDSIRVLRTKGFKFNLQVLGKEYYSVKPGVDSVMVLCNEPEIYLAQNYIVHKYGTNCNAMISMPPCMDVTSVFASKGKALSWLAEYYGYMRNEVMSIGDSFNDFEMLKASGIGVAVGNAHPKLKELADHVTEGCERSGVAEAIRKFVF